MESKQELLEMINKFKGERNEYLSLLFKHVPDVVIKAINYKKVAKDKYILQAETPCDMVYVILSGKVIGVDQQREGHPFYFMDFTHMYVIGDFEVFAGMKEYCASIKTAEKCEFLAIPSYYYLQWVEQDKNALLLRLQNITAILTAEKKNERTYIFMNCKERLIAYLIQSYESRVDYNSKIYKITKTQVEIADRIGFNYRSVQRCIASLEKDNLIFIENGKITISEEQYRKLKGDK